MSNEPIEKHVMIQYGQSFGELCQPIFSTTPINYIGFARIYDDGSRSYLITDPQWGEVLLKNKYHLAGTEDALIHGPQSSYQLWSISSMFALNQQTQCLFKECISNNYGNGITLMERGAHFVEFIHICADGGYESVDPYLINNIDKLWNYVLYIRESLAKNQELNKAYNHKYFYNLKPIPNQFQEMSSLEEKIKIQKYYLGGYFNDVYFTSREMDCLILLYQNKSAKEQARILSLSSRTIEHCLEHIKAKVGCKNKTELLLELTHNNIFNSIVRNKS